MKREFWTWAETLAVSDSPKAANDTFNTMLDELDYTVAEILAVPHGKTIPYMGWFWRDADFHTGQVQISSDGTYTGVDYAQKWGYPTRDLSSDEVQVFMAYLDGLIIAWRGHDLDQTLRTSVALHEWMAQLPLGYPQKPVLIPELTPQENRLAVAAFASGDITTAQRIILDALGRLGGSKE